MWEKKLYNYKKALLLPFMIQKLWRGFTLENPVELTKILVFGGVLLLLLTVFRPIMWLLGMIPGLKFAGYLLIPTGAVLLWEQVEPDGLKIPIYAADYLFYMINFKIGNKVICQNETISQVEGLVVFEKIPAEEISAFSE
ncbi:TcpE family conjugal transfer membrane protein [Enterococcus larvae]|uniref:TcpE family conjugal transfer membrane protein n=1 Tax=Enterococcus larvae TaxID=2794352 RepID=UPI003F3B8C50